MDSYKRYAEIQQLITSLSEEQDKIKDQILKELDEVKKTEYGVFSVRHMKKYVFNSETYLNSKKKIDENIKAEKEALKKIEEEEKKNNRYEIQESKVLAFKKL